MDGLMHYGTPRHSGRYPWGSGKNPQRNKNILTRVDELKKKGLSEAEIAKGFGLSTTQLRAQLSIATNEIKKENIDRAIRLKNEKQYSNTQIAKMMGVSEGTIRNWLEPGAKDKRDSIQQLADTLKKNVDEKGYIDVGRGVELGLNTTETKLKTAVAMLEEQGYKKISVQVDQLGTGDGQKTIVKVLAPPGTTYKDVNMNQDKIRTIEDYISKDAESISKLGLPPVKSIDSKRIQIRYDEDGGTAKDGVIELRRGVDDLSLGKANYAQVRIGVDGTHYLKGMAMYSDNMPEGVDVIFNTNKSQGTPLEKVLKPMKIDAKTGEVDRDNPFGASIKPEDDLKRVPRYYIDGDGNRQVSPINVVNEQGNWSEWSKKIASQMLSKQPVQLVKRQLDLSYDIKKSEFDEIMSLTNATVKKKLLESFANDCDSSAVHLKAAALPRQQSHVILPLTTMSEKEIFAPNYHDGEKVALIRFPHAGTFEIPILTVNNKNKEAISVIGKNASDAVGIHPKVAERLSGADFDGDTVLVIPTNDKIKIKSTSALESLKDFDPKREYKIDRDDPLQDKIPKIKPKTKQNEMGKVSNLITDMTIKGATVKELARAVKHSMVVIDAEKHDLDYRRSAKDNRIDELKKKYQIQPDGKAGGASTIISRAKSEMQVDTRKELSPDPLTGEKRYETKKGDTYIDKKGNVQHRKESSTQMAETNDARTLISNFNTPVERAYANYANQLKALGNEARKAYISIEEPRKDPQAAKVYEKEVASLKNKLNIALKNAPRERQAQLIANQTLSSKKQAAPDMDKDTERKIRGQALASARAKVGAKKDTIQITQREWQAIQSRAVSPTTLSKILNNSDLDTVKKYATPKQSRGLSPAQQALAKSMDSRGYSNSEIADRLGVSASTIQKLVN